MIQALLDTQERIQAMVPGFKFNLGFSGKYFHHGNPEENHGDDMLLSKYSRFFYSTHFIFYYFSEKHTWIM